MTKLQIGTVLTMTVLFLGLYFGFETKPPKQHTTERSDSGNNESGSAANILAKARQQLPGQDTVALFELETALTTAPESDKAELMKRISGWWYAAGNIPAAGIWAEKVAALEQSDSAWSVTGATFFQALVDAQTPELRDFCGKNVIKAFENAASLNPGNVEHRVNLALAYAEYPPADNPMKAVLMLKDLESKHPDNASVFNALGRLAIKTGQWERAIERLEKAQSLDPDNNFTSCLLATAYRGAGNAAKAKEYDLKCR